MPLMADSRFLNSLPADLKAAVSADLERVQLHRGDMLLAAHERIDFIYFPTSCLVSMIITLENGNTVEAATVGNDGFAGVSAFLGMERADITAVVQIEGEALRMRIADFRRFLADEHLRKTMGGFAAKTMATIAQSAACNAFHPVQERLARWLLLVRDSMERDEFTLTQDFIAVMLGVHRPLSPWQSGSWNPLASSNTVAAGCELSTAKR
jgi:CRP-like cAMP-binding protein